MLFILLSSLIFSLCCNQLLVSLILDHLFWFRLASNLLFCFDRTIIVHAKRSCWHWQIRLICVLLVWKVQVALLRLFIRLLLVVVVLTVVLYQVRLYNQLRVVWAVLLHSVEVGFAAIEALIAERLGRFRRWRNWAGNSRRYLRIVIDKSSVACSLARLRWCLYHRWSLIVLVHRSVTIRWGYF